MIALALAARRGEDPMRGASLADRRLTRTATRALEPLAKRRQVGNP